MTDPSREPPSARAEAPHDADSARRASWRKTGPGSAARGPTVLAALLLAGSAAAATFAAAALILAPLFAWQTAGLAIVVDRYVPDLTGTLPFANEDLTGLTEVLDGRLAPSLAQQLVRLDEFDTAASMRDRLHGYCIDLPLRSKDSLIAYVRGQCLVPPPLLDTDGLPRADRLAGHACLVAGDATLRGEGLRELVPIRDIVEAIGAAPSHTTLLAVDMGDLRWDPRIGVLCGIASRQLERDLVPPAKKANGQNWVLASHDVLEYSGVAATARRTFFCAALEAGLAGAADTVPWGNGNRIVELHELAPFVAAWTTEWARRTSGGRSVQRPVLIKLGTGRVAFDAIPRGIRLIRVPASSASLLQRFASRMPAVPGGKAASPSGEAAPAGGSPAPPGAPPTPAAPATAAPAAPGPEAVPATPPAAAGSVTAPPGPVPPAATSVGGTATSPAGPATTSAVAAPATAPSSPPQSATSETDAATSPGGGPPTGGAPSGEAPAGATGPAPPAAAPAAAPATKPARPIDDPFILLERIVNRDVTEGIELGVTIVDYAPHVWRRAVAHAAAISVDDSASSDRAKLVEALRRLDDTSAAGKTAVAASDVVEGLSRATNAARESGAIREWSLIPAQDRSALAVRNDSVEFAWSSLQVLGGLSGGAGPLPIEPEMLRNFILRIRNLSDLLAQAATLGTAMAAADRNAMESSTRGMRSYASVMRTLHEQIIAGLTSTGPGAADATFHERQVILHSRLPTAAQRRLLATSVATTPGSLSIEGPQPSVSPAGRAIDRQTWTNVVTLTGAVLDLAEASGTVFAATEKRESPGLSTLRDEITAARRAIATLEPETGDDPAAITALLAVGARTSRLLARAAAQASKLSRESIAPGPDAPRNRVSGLLRILDPRDAVEAGETTLAGPARWEVAVGYGLTLTLAELPAATGGSQGIRLVVTDATKLPDDATIAFRFDPALATIRLSEGTSLSDGVPEVARDLPWRDNAIDLEVALLRRPTPLVDARGVSVSVLLSTAGTVERSMVDLRPAEEQRLLVAARFAEGTVLGRPGQDGWVRSSRIAAGGDDAVPRTLLLVGRSAQVTAWSLGIENLSCTPRKIAVDLHSVRPVADVPREQTWRSAVAAIRAGDVAEKPLASIAELSLTADIGVTPVGFPPPQPPAATPTAGAAPAALELPSPASAPQIGPDLALVIRDFVTKDVLVTRIMLEPRHPRDVVTPVAEYDMDSREIRVRVAPAPGMEASLPAGMPVALTVPDPAARVVPRKPKAVVGGAAADGELVASWTGPDQGIARFAIDVDGYPRAFTFAVDCSAAANRLPQGPQRDWRQARILEPATGTTTQLAAPVEKLPLRLAIDAPADAFSMAKPSIQLVLRPLDSGTGTDSTERVAWMADADRAVAFTMATAAPGTSLAARTDVTDWAIEPSGAGLANVDVSAELRLAVPGAAESVGESRSYVFDGRPPTVEVPVEASVTVGRSLTIPFLASDDIRDGYFTPPERRRPGVSGIRTVEWAIDRDGTGAPKEWQPAVRVDGARYEVRMDTKALPLGTRLPLLVRATDLVGLAGPPARTWLVVAADPASPRNAVTGRVMADGRGEPGVKVTLSGPGGDRTITSGPEGNFRFEDLEPASYKVSASGPVRNRVRKAPPQDVTLPASPAPPAAVTLVLE